MKDGTLQREHIGLSGFLFSSFFFFFFPSSFLDKAGREHPQSPPEVKQSFRRELSSPFFLFFWVTAVVGEEED